MISVNISTTLREVYAEMGQRQMAQTECESLIDRFVDKAQKKLIQGLKPIISDRQAGAEARILKNESFF